MKDRKKLLIYKILLFAFAFFIAFMPSTAMRSQEVNSRVIVEILGIDGKDKISLTAQYVMPTDSQESTGKDTVTVTGDTLTEAVETLNTALGRRAELGHCSMVIIGKDVDPSILGTLMTATDVTADVWLSAAEDNAEKLIGDITDFMSKTGATDADFIAYSARKAHIATNTLLGFLSDLGSASKSAYIPVVQMLEDCSGDGEQQGGESGGSGGESSGGTGGGQEQSGSSGGEGGGAEQKKNTGMCVDRLAVYADNARVGILERESARGVAWASAPIEKGIVVADIDYGGKTVKNVSGRLLKKYSSVKIDAKHERATVKIKAYIEPNGDKFNEIGSSNSEKANAALRAGFAKQIKHEVECAYADTVAVNCDPLFVGREFYRYAPDYYENGYVYANIKVDVEVNVAIK